jgi:hypothetical protein
MRSVPVVVIDILAQDDTEMTFADNQQAVGALAAHGPHPPLGKGIRPRRLYRRLDHSGPRRSKHVVEHGGELGIAVTDQEPEDVAPLVEPHQEIPRLLRHPRPGRVRGHTQDVDGARPDTHDAHRGPGSFTRTIEGIRTLVDLDLPVRVALTETEQNTADIPEVVSLLADLGVPKEDFAVRPLLRRGLSGTGLDIGEDTTVPELTITADGLHWHPAGADAATSPDMLLARGAVSLAEGKRLVTERFFTARLADGSLPAPYRCAI